jgi:CheY-like chemotaxis protein
MAVKRILIIDDARDIGRMYQQALRTAYPRLQVIYVPSAEEAIVEAITYTVDLMVVDIRLPGMSGFDLVRRVRLRQPDVKVIMITGMRLEGEVERQSKEVNAACLLRKPVSIADFLEAVKKTIGDETVEVEAEGKGSQKTRDKTAPIHRPAETPPVPQADPAPEPSLSESLAGLRGSLGALAVLLLDDTGRVTAQAGDWPSSELAATLVPDLMAGMSAAHKVSRQIGAPIPDAVQALRGKDYDLLAAPVGRYALLIFLKRGPGALRMALAFEEALLAQKQFARFLSELGLNISPILSQPERPPEQSGVGEAVRAAQQPSVADNELAEPPAAALQALEEMLASPPAGPSTQDAEAFWDKAEGDETPVPANADVLTYEQAMKLGLFPEEH